MASITSLTNSTSSTSSLYGNKNIISGLASGMDTEAMIENSIAGYKTKIQNLVNQQTKLTWKQDAYRSITDQLIALSTRYTSYTSKTNLASNSFFNKAVKTVTGGDYASRIAATGSTKSDVQINSVQQMATAASYKVDVGSLGALQNASSLTGGAIDWDTPTEVSDMTGYMTIKVGAGEKATSIDLNFTDADLETLKSAGTSKAQALADLISSKLGDKAGYVNVSVEDDAIRFSTGSDAAYGDEIWISAAGGSIAKTLGITGGDMSSGDRSITVSEDVQFSHEVSKAESLAGKEFNITLDGTRKTITLGDMKDEDGNYLQGDALRDRVMSELEDGLKGIFGGKVSVALNGDGALEFSTTSNNSSLKIDSTAGAALGMGDDLTSYMNTSKTLGSLLGSDMGGMSAITVDSASIASGSEKTEDGVTTATDSNGNRVMLDSSDGQWYRVDAGNNKLYEMKINDKTVGTFTRNTALETVLNSINNSGAGVKASYSELTDKLTFTAAETGADSQIKFDEFAKKLFGDPDTAGTYQKGQDAIVNVTVNGDNLTLTRSSNVVSIDGLSVTLKGTFNEGVVQYAADGTVDSAATAAAAAALDPEKSVTFTTSSDSDTIVDTVKSFVEEINNILKSTHEAYSTSPLKTSGNSSYEPLSDDDKASMSESQIKAYEEKAQTGILFGDRTLSQLYSQLRSIISGSGMDAGVMRDIGLTTDYSNGLTTLKLDEDKLREALAADPDKVRDLFTKTKENGAEEDGLMAKLSGLLDRYASTSIGKYGTLVQMAGTKTKSLTLLSNTMQKQIDSLDNEIDRWKVKMSSKIDYYTRQFSALEQLINTMNSQSSALQGLMGY